MPAQPKIRVTTNNDIAYIWWGVPSRIDGALGFSIHRETESGDAEPLKAWVGFKRATGPQKPKDTDRWPIQAFQWKDVYAPREGRFRYHIYVVRGTANKPKRDRDPLISSDWVGLDEQIGPFTVVFNRGLLSTQAMNRGTNAPGKNTVLLRKAIGTPNNRIRLRLTKELLPTMYSLLRRARENGGKCYAALYELTDGELVSELLECKDAELVLANANSSKTVDRKAVTVYDGTNVKVRKQLRNAKYRMTDRLLKGNSIGHNKFIVYADERGPAAVLTGSTNWTATGICGQTNNAMLIENRRIAEHYFEYWQRLRDEEGTMQGPELREWARSNALDLSLGNEHGSVKIWFSPNTVRRSKSTAETPADMEEIFEIIDGAKSAVLFLLFNPGTPSIVQRIREAEAKRAKGKTPLYVRGAISDARTAREGSVNIFSRTAKQKADTVITGVAGVLDDFGYWEKELLKLGHAAIHDKVMVVDPFSKDCVVVTGSHNLGYKASFSNDENMVIIRGNRRVADAFTTHVLDVVNHYKWRYKLQELRDQGKLNRAWQDLDETDRWQDKYFDSRFLASRDQFILQNA